MSDIAKYNGRYNLIFSDPNTSTLVKKREPKSSPSTTSILQALEDNKNAANLFYMDNSEINCNYLLDSLTNMREGIDKMKHWLNVNFVENVNCLNNNDLFDVTAKLNAVADDFRSCFEIVQRMSKQQAKKMRKSKYKCTTCGEKLVVNKNEGVDKLEMHCHVAEVLSRGKILEPLEVYEPQLFSGYLNALEDQKPLTSAPSIHEELNSSNVVTTNTVAQVFKNTIDITQNYLHSRYCARVTEVLYPSDLTTKVSQIENNNQLYTIRVRIPNEVFDCLICLNASSLTYSSIMEHVRGKKHLSKTKQKFDLNRAINYHSVFSNLAEEYQIHQVMFRPGYKFPLIYCHVCCISINGSKIINHIENNVHKERVMSCARLRKMQFYSEIINSINNSEKTFEASIANEDSQSNNTLVVENTQLIRDDVSDDFNEVSTSSSDPDIQELLKQFTSKMLQPARIYFNSNLIKEDPKTTTNETTSLSGIAKKGQKKIESSSSKNSAPSTKICTPNAVTEAGTASTSESTPSTSSQKNGPSNDFKKIPVKAKKPLKHNIVPAFKSNPQNVFELLENRLQVHLEFMNEIESKTVEGKMYCDLCTQTFPKNERAIKNHITNRAHKKNIHFALGGHEYIYYCDLCFKNINGECKWEGHLISVEHKQRLEVIQNNKEPRGGLFVELECSNCKFVMFGNKNTINKHLRGTITRDKPRKLPKVIKLPNKIVDLLSNEKLFNLEIEKLHNDSEVVLNLLSLSYTCCAAIEKALEPTFGYCKAYPFGSRVSGLGNSVSDLDVFVDTGSMYDGDFDQDGPSQAKLVTDTAQILRKNKNFTEVCPIPQARTPIVQVLHRVTGLDCDLSFRHGLSVENTNYLRLCISIQPKMKSLILFVKKWAGNCLSNKISTYALSMMVIFFMQNKGLLPSVQKLRDIDPTEPNVIAGWKTYSFNKPISELTAIYPSTDMSIRNLLQDYFEYYINFPFSKEVVCPLLGRTVPKLDFHEDKAQRLPEEMAVYVERINSDEDSEMFRCLSAMCVQDPFDLSHNLTKAVSGDNLTKFITLSKLSVALLIKPKSIS